MRRLVGRNGEKNRLTEAADSGLLHPSPSLAFTLHLLLQMHEITGSYLTSLQHVFIDNLACIHLFPLESLSGVILKITVQENTVCTQLDSHIPPNTAALITDMSKYNHTLGNCNYSQIAMIFWEAVTSIYSYKLDADTAWAFMGQYSV